MISERVGDVGDVTRAMLAAWFDEHGQAVYAYLARRVGEELARDLAAETFRVALQQFDRFDPGRGSARAWLFGIATNLLRHHWRDERRHIGALARQSLAALGAVDPTVAVDDRIDALRRIDRLVAALDRLAPADRDLLALVVWEGCTSAEVAQALGIPAGTVRSRLRRIRASLAREGMTS